jgi:dolichol-phosphate mannosyltransferase
MAVTTAPRPLVSVLFSFRNEESVLPELLSRLAAALADGDFEYELVFVNDCSTDASLSILQEAQAADPRVRVLNTSRRFGVYECIRAGLEHARGDAVVYMDSDLQDPPELIPTLIARWQDGADVVYTVRRSRAGEAAFKLFLTRLAYRVIRAAADVPIPVDAGDFRLMSRRVVDQLLRWQEPDVYFRGIMSWVGFKQVPVEYDREPRRAGATHWPLLGRFWHDLTTLTGSVGGLLTAVTSFAISPLLLFLPLGAACLGLVLVLAAVLAGTGHLGGATQGALLLVLLALSALQLFALGIMGLYLAVVLRQVRGRPVYLLESVLEAGRVMNPTPEEAASSAHPSRRRN